MEHLGDPDSLVIVELRLQTWNATDRIDVVKRGLGAITTRKWFR